ncbi:MAG: hypothetical protein JO035_01840 [Betaproteobacteria bacterium]|nr:hypothetical protein [Betaproteobacteria bacterium]
MKAKVLAVAVLSAVSAGAFADTVVPDKAPVVAAPVVAAPVVTAPAVVAPVTTGTIVASPSAGSSAQVVAPAVVTPAPVVATQPAVVVPVYPQAPVTPEPGQSGPGAINKTRPGIDDSMNHSTRDAGTSSAGG